MQRTFLNYIRQVVKDTISHNENMAFIFNQSKFGKHMLLSIIVLWISSFATIEIMGVDPQKAKLKDFVVGVMHLGFQAIIVI